MKVKVVRAAKMDLVTGFRFYERQERGLGDYFLQCIETDLIDLERTAGIHRQIAGFYHVNSQTFNSILYYRIIENEAQVMAILDGRMKPERLDRVLKRR